MNPLRFQLLKFNLPAVPVLESPRYPITEPNAIASRGDTQSSTPLQPRTVSAGTIAAAGNQFDPWCSGSALGNGAEMQRPRSSGSSPDGSNNTQPTPAGKRVRCEERPRRDTPQSVECIGAALVEFNFAPVGKCAKSAVTAVRQWGLLIASLSLVIRDRIPCSVFKARNIAAPSISHLTSETGGGSNLTAEASQIPAMGAPLMVGLTARGLWWITLSFAFAVVCHEAANMIFGK